MPFLDWEQEIAPPWLQDSGSRVYFRQRGAVRDALVDRLKQAVKLRFARLAPSDALDELGVERGIPRAPGESDAAYATRLRDAWDTWQWAGTPYGMLSALHATGYTDVRLLIVQGKQYTLDGSGNLVITDLAAGSWAIDATPTMWNKFQVLFPGPNNHWAAQALSVPAESSAEATFIKALVRAWKPAHAFCAGIVIHTAGELIGYPFRTLGTGTLGGGAATLWTVD